MILSLGRSGSNTLLDLVNQHPEVLNMGEVLGPWTQMRKLRERVGLWRGDNGRYLDGVTTSPLFRRAFLARRNLSRFRAGRRQEMKRHARLRTVGLKDFSLIMAQEGVRHWLCERPDVRVIGLVRDDVLDRLMSSEILRATRLVKSRDGRQHDRNQAITIDPEKIFAMMDVIDRENRELADMLTELPPDRVRIVRYDEFYRDEATRRRIMGKIFAFLGVRLFETEIRMKKLITVPAAEMIANRAECAAVLRGTRFEGMLDP